MPETGMTSNILEEIITPGFYETDAIGHINNTVVPMWFEKTRMPLFKVFTPDLDPEKWNLILVKIEVDYLNQISYKAPVMIKTGINKIGNSSFVVQQEASQNDKRCARGLTTMVHFDYSKNKSQPLKSKARHALEQYLWPTEY